MCVTQFNMAAAIAVTAQETVEQNCCVVYSSRGYTLFRYGSKNISIEIVTLET